MFSGIFKSIFGGDGGQPQYRQNLSEGMKKYVDPYFNQGLSQGDLLSALSQRMAVNPTEFYNELMSGYQESPEIKLRADRAQDAALNAASASGMLGSTDLLRRVQEMNNQVNLEGRQQERQQLLDNLMRILGGGIGVSQNLYGIGAGMAGQGLEAQSGLARSAQEQSIYGQKNLRDFLSTMLGTALGSGRMGF